MRFIPQNRCYLKYRDNIAIFNIITFNLETIFLTRILVKATVALVKYE